MKKFITFLKETRFPNKRKLKTGYEALSFKETLFVVFFTLVALVSVVIILGKVNNNFITEVPVAGGSITEGIVGMPTQVNPVLAVSDADKDLTTLVYSGLLRQAPDGSYVPDLAESYEISPDGTRYTFTLKKGLTFHDKNDLTIEDVSFTINKIKDPSIKSPRRVQWEGVSVEPGANENQIVFVLKKPYASFIDNLTVGILPSHLWKGVNPSDFSVSPLNVKAVGSGPYMIDAVERDSEGVPQKYTLKRNKYFSLGKPYVKEIIIKSYSNEKDLVSALRSGSVDQAGGISPENAKSFESKNKDIQTMVLPRMFGLFFNSNKNKALGDIAIKKAIDQAIDRQKLIDEVLLGYGIPIDSPIPQGILSHTSVSATEKDWIPDFESIYKSLKSAGWEKDESGILGKSTSKTTISTVKGKKVTKTVKSDPEPLVFSITTGDAPELVASATEIKRQLEDLGMTIELRVYETGQLNQVIRDRDYEILFFGQVVNHGSDLFAFWHSSQKTDPGLNIALFGNEKADLALNIAETILSREERSQKYVQFENIWRENMGSVFIYSPEYIYVTSKKTHIPKNYHFTNSQSRLENVYSWYTNTDKVWKIFSKD